MNKEKYEFLNSTTKIYITAWGGLTGIIGAANMYGVVDKLKDNFNLVSCHPDEAKIYVVSGLTIAIGAYLLLEGITSISEMQRPFPITCSLLERLTKKRITKTRDEILKEAKEKDN